MAPHSLSSDGQRPIRVLFLSKGLDPGGSERLLVDQAVAWRGQVEITVAYTVTRRDWYVPPLREAGIEVVGLGGGHRWLWPFRLARLLRSGRPDVVHCHSPVPAVAARLFVRLGLAGRGASSVTTEHNTWQDYHMVTRVLNALTLPLDRRVWAVSDHARASVWPRRSRRRVVALHHGINVDATRQAADAEPGGDVPETEPGTFTFLHVANLRPPKAHQLLLDAFRDAAAIEPRLRLWMVGLGVDRAALQRLGVDGGDDLLALRILPLGPRGDVPALMARADALVLSSYHEGMPLVVLEALALGTPVVSTAAGGVPEAIANGSNGLLVPVGDRRALAEALVRLSRDEALYSRLEDGAVGSGAVMDAEVARSVQLSAYRDLASGRRG